MRLTETIVNTTMLMGLLFMMAQIPTISNAVNRFNLNGTSYF